ncbi:YbjN domain-containing protein [Micromonospora sp. C28SCA-DRY-2]|uniref:YbjN domain-containing protein n=1 Tax=Micromonospora sp. C28SCA-DRY-2 TaxID=3059522 RepID=UPI00267756EE|nr:YbjN domain-containing protein [Micromonospora sp. C28SCA-DRY-2]MDO3700567.1 YbjN domain-containing protein [Micromonospora sp. C28SCA-DRY-2]
MSDALADARDLPDGEARTAELERVAAHADAAGDDRCAVAARFALVEAYLRDGERWRLVEPVRRCLAAVDRRPDLLPAADAELLLRYQRYAVEALLGTPRVGLDQARSMLDDLTERTASGAGDAAVVAELRCRIADHLGDEPTARRWYDRWTAAEPGPADGCPGCAPARRADLLAGWGDWPAALDELRDPLDGTLTCTEQPERALAAALLPWLRAGEPERAGAAHVRAYRRHRREPAAFPYLSAHLRFCALGGHLDRGLDILAEQLPRLDRPADDLSAMEFAAAGALLCALAVEAGLGHRTLRRPAAGPRPAAELDVETLGHTLLGTATRLAGSFDARNGTGHQSGRIASWLAERPLAAPVPLPADGAPDDPDDPLDGDDGPAELEPAPLTLAMITAELERRGDRYEVDGAGTVFGRWGEALIQFRRAGERGEILHVRVVAARRLPAVRRAEAYAFCNAWNHDRLLPKAYVHDLGGELALAGDVSTDLAHGVAPAQLAVLLDAAVRTGAGYAEAVAALP